MTQPTSRKKTVSESYSASKHTITISTKSEQQPETSMPPSCFDPSICYVYIIRCTDDSLYTGITKDVLRRMQEHYYHTKNGAKYTKSHPPKELMMVWQAFSWSAAAILEHFIKTLPRHKKLALINVPDSVNAHSATKLKGNIYTPLETSSGLFPIDIAALFNQKSFPASLNSLKAHDTLP